MTQRWNTKSPKLKLLNYIFGWLFFVSGMLIVSYKVLLFLGLVRPALTAIDEVGAMLTVLVGAVMIGIGAVVDRLDTMKEREGAASRTYSCSPNG